MPIMSNTGYKIWLRRIKKWSDDDSNAGVVEINTEFLPDGVTPDPNYIPKEYDPLSCPLPITTYPRTLSDTGTGVITCQSGGAWQNAYTNNQFTNPAVGNYFYQDTDGYNPWPGGNRWWNFNGSTATQVKIDNNGRVTQIQTGCPEL
jgi:hypothetical protein